MTPSRKKSTKGNFSFLYGPVPSRRLGYSLGVDILPFKTCSLDCIYCQLGPTGKQTVQRKSYFRVEEILSQLRAKLTSHRRIDFITFSGSGEPTLNLQLKTLIKEIKNMTSIPVAVLTNSTLLGQKNVRESLKEADVVAPSLDAANQEVFEKVNRPHSSLKLDEIVEGLMRFRQEFPGQIWLEIMLIRENNDSPSQIKALKKLTDKIQPDKIHLNTVVRPPAEKDILPVDETEIKRIQLFFGKNCTAIAEFTKQKQASRLEDPKNGILEMLKRRPATIADIAASLGLSDKAAKKHLDSLLKKGLIHSLVHKGRTYFEPN